MTRPIRVRKPSRFLSVAVLFCTAVFCCAGLIWAESNAQFREEVAVAKAIVQWLNEKNWRRVMDEFNVSAKEHLPVERLEMAWNSFTVQLGGYQRIEGVRMEKGPEGENTVVVSCFFERDTINMKVVFDQHQQVDSLQFSPSEAQSSVDLDENAVVAASAEPVVDFSTKQWAVREDQTAASKPILVSKEAFEQELIIGSDPWSLPATLTIPPGEGPFPAIVLVHGSGPQDRDETIGPNKPFRDLAAGLSLRGIAVLRYEKRTKAHQLQMAALKDLTVKEEVIDDALAACAVLRANKQIDAKRLFVLGHSLGGWMVPRIAAADKQLSGAIILAGNTRPMEKLIIDQLQYFALLDGVVTPAEQAQIDQLQLQADKINDPKLGIAGSGVGSPFGVTASYWLDLRGYQAATLASQLDLPLLILQGERDYQVTMVDFAGWKEALGNKPNVKLKSYPGLNHLFIEGEGKSQPSEYERPGHMATGVIQDIADWILGQSPVAARAGAS